MDDDWRSPWADDTDSTKNVNKGPESTDISEKRGSLHSSPPQSRRGDHHHDHHHDPWAGFGDSSSPWAAAADADAFPDWTVTGDRESSAVETTGEGLWAGGKGLSPGGGYERWGGGSEWGTASSVHDGDVAVTKDAGIEHPESPKLELPASAVDKEVHADISLGIGDAEVETKIEHISELKDELPAIVNLDVPPAPPPEDPNISDAETSATNTAIDTDTAPTALLPEEVPPTTLSDDITTPASTPHKAFDEEHVDGGSDVADDNDDFGDFGDFAEEADFDDYASAPPTPPPPPLPSQTIPAFSIDCSLVHKLYPIPTSIPDLPPLESDIINSIGARKAWYRLTQAGALRKNHAPDDDYVCVKWIGSKVQGEVHNIVGKWLGESRTSGIGGKGSRNQGAMFGWGAASVPKPHKKRLSLQNHSRHSSESGMQTPVLQLNTSRKPSIERPSVPSPLTSSFGWASASNQPSPLSKTNFSVQASPIGKLDFGGQASPMAKSSSGHASPLGKMNFDVPALTPAPSSAPASRRVSLALGRGSIQNSPTTPSFAHTTSSPAPATPSFAPATPSFAPTTLSFAPTTPSFPLTTSSPALTTPSFTPATPFAPTAPSFAPTTPYSAPTTPAFTPTTPSFKASAKSNGSETPKSAIHDLESLAGPGTGPLTQPASSSLDDWANMSAGVSSAIPSTSAKDDLGGFDGLGIHSPASADAGSGFVAPTTSAQDDWGKFEDLVSVAPSSGAKRRNKGVSVEPKLVEDEWAVFGSFKATSPHPASPASSLDSANISRQNITPATKELPVMNKPTPASPASLGNQLPVTETAFGSPISSQNQTSPKGAEVTKPGLALPMSFQNQPPAITRPTPAFPVITRPTPISPVSLQNPLPVTKPSFGSLMPSQSQPSPKVTEATKPNLSSSMMFGNQSPTKPSTLVLSTSNIQKVDAADDDDEWGEMQSPIKVADAISRIPTPIPMPMGLITPARSTFTGNGGSPFNMGQNGFLNSSIFGTQTEVNQNSGSNFGGPAALVETSSDPWDLSFFEKPSQQPPVSAPRPVQRDLWDAPVPVPKKGKKELEEDEIIRKIIKGLPDLSYMLG